MKRGDEWRSRSSAATFVTQVLNEMAEMGVECLCARLGGDAFAAGCCEKVWEVE